MKLHSCCKQLTKAKLVHPLLNRELLVHALPDDIQARIKVRFGDNPPKFHPFPNPLESLFQEEKVIEEDITVGGNEGLRDEIQPITSPSLQNPNLNFDEDIDFVRDFPIDEDSALASLTAELAVSKAKVATAQASEQLHLSCIKQLEADLEIKERALMQKDSQIENLKSQLSQVNDNLSEQFRLASKAEADYSDEILKLKKQIELGHEDLVYQLSTIQNELKSNNESHEKQRTQLEDTIRSLESNLEQHQLDQESTVKRHQFDLDAKNQSLSDQSNPKKPSFKLPYD
ncbi:hypothetical protein BC833DRAFT_624839 [Globomyces pollinis-pini]|nr:hypothetical protein BC833DRAFT_624839 [Globomyces pollinis-pini]